MEMKEYKTPEMEIIYMKLHSILCASPEDGTDETPDSGDAIEL